MKTQEQIEWELENPPESLRGDGEVFINGIPQGD
jgi:hypothetical protein